MRSLQPPVVRILEPDIDDLRLVWSVAPNALILVRYWWLDDGDRHQHAEMVRDPVGTAQRHAAEWRVQLTKLGALGNPQVIPTGVNEPSVNEQNVRWACVEYTKVLLQEFAAYGQRGGALNLAVGHPAHLHNGQPDWRDYLSLGPVIQQTNSVLVLHEYWQQEGPDKPEDWTWLAGRHLSCPLNVPIVIGESGVDGGIYNRYPSNLGYRGVQPPVPEAQYAEQLVWYHNHVSPNVLGICPFTTDYRDNHWASFDTLPAHNEILNRKALLVSASPPPITPPPVTIPQPPDLLPTRTLFHPLPGATITQHFFQNPKDYARFDLPGHNGTDLGGKPAGEPVRALGNGTVAFVGTDPAYGNYIRTTLTGLGAYAFYAHLSETKVIVGQALKAGDVIGSVGSTGNSTGPHLHLEIRLHNPDGSYNEIAPMRRGRCDPETFCALHGLALDELLEVPF
jgi:hypothetical protein